MYSGFRSATDGSATSGNISIRSSLLMRSGERLPILLSSRPSEYSAWPQESESMTDSVLVIGASVAGVGAANELRRCGFPGRITLVDGQAHLPYDRPPLSKGALYGQDSTIPDLQFHDRDHYARTNIDLQLGTAAQMLDLETR